VTVKILPTALQDLDRGRRFYARQRRSLGDYFLDSLFADIDSLELYAGIHMKVFATYCFLSASPWVRIPPSPPFMLPRPFAGVQKTL
jgi:hypothetical protein